MDERRPASVGSSQLQKFMLLAVTGLILAISYVITYHIFMYWDVSWHIQAANRMLHGGSYIRNLVDDNPPMTFAFFLPLALWQQISGVLSVHVASAYIYATYLIGLTLSYIILAKSSFLPWKRNVIYIAVVLGVLILGITILGQRELNAVCFFTPYLLNNLFNKKLSLKYSIAIAVLAVLGITQVPFYCLLPVVIDIISVIKKQNHLRQVQICFYALFVFTMSVNYILYPGYFNVLVPILASAQAALNANYESIFGPIFFNALGFCFALMVLLLFRISNKLEIIKLLLVIVTCMCIYLMEGKSWYYHFFPVIYFIVLTFIYVITLQDFSKWFKTETIVPFVVLLMFVFMSPLLLIRGNATSVNNKTSDLYKIIQFSRSIQNKNATALFFTTRVTPTYLVQLYTGLNVISPWANDWLTPSIVDNKTSMSTKIQLKVFYKRLLVKSMQSKPDYIFYITGKSIPYISQEKFNYYNYLSEEMGFASQLKNYKSIGSVGNFVILRRKDSVG